MLVYEGTAKNKPNSMQADGFLAWLMLKIKETVVNSFQFGN